MSTYIVDGPCPKPSCASLVKYGVDHIDGIRVLAGTCPACGAFRAYDGAKNIIVLAEE